MPGFLDMKEAASILNSPGLRPGFLGSEHDGKSLKMDPSASQGLLRNETIKESIKRAGNSSSEPQLDLSEYQQKHISDIRKLMNESIRDKHGLNKINMGDQASFKYGNF